MLEPNVRSVVLVALLTPLLALGAQDYYIAPLMGTGKGYTAPPIVRTKLAQRLEADLRLCVAETRWGLKKPEDFFAAVPLKVSAARSDTFLVFPSQYCPGGLFGAHSVPLWVVSAPVDGSFKVLLEDTADGIRVLKAQSNGMSDIATLHGDEESSLYRFNGDVYSAPR